MGKEGSNLTHISINIYPSAIRHKERKRLQLHFQGLEPTLDRTILARLGMHDWQLLLNSD